MRKNSVSDTVWKYFIDEVTNFVMVSNINIGYCEYQYYTFALLDKYHRPRYYAIVMEDNPLIPYGALILNTDYSPCLDGRSPQSAKFAAKIKNLFGI